MTIPINTVPVKKLVGNLASASTNLHVSVPACLALACELGKVWFPGHSLQFDETQKMLMAYGLIAAANSAPQTKE